jgi:hypothetical protein
MAILKLGKSHFDVRNVFPEHEKSNSEVRNAFSKSRKSNSAS